MDQNKDKKQLQKEVIIDVVKELMLWAAITIGAFLYWMLVLLILSIFLLNIWHVTFEEILGYGIGLTVISSIVYALIHIRRKLK